MLAWSSEAAGVVPMDGAGYSTEGQPPAVKPRQLLLVARRGLRFELHQLLESVVA